MSISDTTRRQLQLASTATLTSELLRRGLRNTFIYGVRPLRPDLRLVGEALTLRYVPAREDVGMDVDYDNRTNVQRLAVEAIGPGQVMVIDARGDTGAASFGQILATRIRARGAAGLVTDGALRDTTGFASLDLPAYCAGAHATTSAVRHHPVEMNVPIGCGGVLVMPGDVVVGDAEGVVVIPAGLAESVAHGAAEQERLESFLLDKVQAGASVVGVYPPNPETRAEYEQQLRHSVEASTDARPPGLDESPGATRP